MKSGLSHKTFHSADTTRWVGRLPAILLALLRRPKLTRVVADLGARNREQAELIRRQADALAHYKKIIDISFAEAKIGVWECNLADNSLSWTNGTFDLFEVPRDAHVTRAEILDLYDDESRRLVEISRAKAIEERGGFTLDARITTAKGNERWLRLTANVECEDGVPVRIFGMKQDITDEKNLLCRLRHLAECDLLTGLANRGLVQKRLLDARNDRGQSGAVGALLLIDLDGFKQINDTFGHSAGDECLKQVADRMRRVCHRNDLIARMGGDEFAVVMGADTTSAIIEERTEHLLAEFRKSIDWNEHTFRLSASIGVTILKDTKVYDPTDFFIEADLALYAAKAAGRNMSRIFTPDLRAKADARFTMIRGQLFADALPTEAAAIWNQPTNSETRKVA